jgi:RimJ/RimL family protein N-acetyltransferase
MTTQAETRESSRESIVTPRLLLRQHQAGDIATISALAETAAVARQRDEIGDARAWIARARLTPEATVFAVVERASGAYIGAVGAAPMPELPSRTELGVWIGEPHSGRGYATEALQAVIDHSFVAGAAEALWGVSRVTNSRARRVIEKCGFQYRENGMARSVALRGSFPVERFILERRVWLSLKAWGGMPGSRGDGAAPPTAA